MITPPLTSAALAFMAERHLATLTTHRRDGSPHVVPVGFTFAPETGVVRIITFAAAVKAGNADRGGRAAVCQVDGARWITLEGPVQIERSPAVVAQAVAAYAERYRPPKQRIDRVVIEILVDRVMSSARLQQ